ncbi:hypothetical protein Tco_0804112 [Tanacetum coccineum]|uniref:Reverse transcriptase domain-containing protein n=1 Tax=Tanacetum coccineum TaxID=301880 RepID=A0ABQ5A3H2_9ASTR
MTIRTLTRLETISAGEGIGITEHPTPKETKQTKQCRQYTSSINEWYQLKEAFTNRYSIRRACYKEPHEITKVVRRANETLLAFKERWTVDVDEGSSVEVMFEHCFENLPPKVRAGLRETRTDLVGFAGEIAKPLGKIDLEVCFGNEGLSRRMSMTFLVVRAPSPYNIILGRPGLKALHAIPSTIHAMIRFPTPKGIATLVTRSTIIAECRLREEKQILTESQPEVHETGQPDEGTDLTEQILVNPHFPDQIITIGGRLSSDCKNQLKTLLINNMEVFAFRPVKYPTYISNPVLVRKCDGSWRMCIDFKNLNSACPKDYYPLPSIDCKVEAVMGFKYKCFLDAYKGYHQIQMAREDEEKTAFYTEQGTYCYMKMPFGRNYEAYGMDMVIKSKDEKDPPGQTLQKF